MATFGLSVQPACAANACLGLAEEVRYSILPVGIGVVMPFFRQLGKVIALHLLELNPYKSAMVELRYEVR